MVVIPTSRPTKTLLSCRVAMWGDSSFMKSATRWVISNCQSGLRRWLSWPQGPAPSDTNWVRTRTVACWNCRVQPRPLCSSSSSSSLSRVGLCGRKSAGSELGRRSLEDHRMIAQVFGSTLVDSAQDWRLRPHGNLGSISGH